MGNMSYCRFHNTALDLGECVEVLEEAINGDDTQNLSTMEASGLADMVNLAESLLDLVGEATTLMELKEQFTEELFNEDSEH